MQNPSWLIAILLVALVALPLAAQAPGQSDLSAIYQIKDEGFNHSQIMDTMSYLTDVYGPRLTNSPGIKQAAEWTTNKMKEWQLANVHLEPWGPFGRGWSNERFSAQVISPRPFPLIAYAKAWTPGTNGPVTAEAVWAFIQKEEGIENTGASSRGNLYWRRRCRKFLRDSKRRGIATLTLSSLTSLHSKYRERRRKTIALRASGRSAS